MLAEPEDAEEERWERPLKADRSQRQAEEAEPRVADDVEERDPRDRPADGDRDRAQREPVLQAHTAPAALEI